MLNKKILIFLSFLLVFPFFIVLGNEEKYTIDEYPQTVVYENKNIELKYSLVSNENLDLDILNVSGSITDENNKTEDINNDIILDQNNGLIDITINKELDNGLYKVGLNIEYQGERNEIRQNILIKEGGFDFELKPLFDDIVNIYNETQVVFEFKYNNISKSELNLFNIDADINGVPLDVSIDDNLKLSISKNIIKNFKNSKITINIKELNYSESFAIDIENKEQLFAYGLYRHHMEMKVGDVSSIYAVKIPYQYQCSSSGFISSNEDVITVSDTGALIATGVGKSVITSYCDDKTSRAVIDVNNDPEEVWFANSDNYIEIGKTKDIELKYYPEDSELKIEDLYLRSSDFVTAGINNGKITGYKTGIVEVTFFYNHMEHKTNYVVVPAVREIAVDQDYYKIQVDDVIKLEPTTLPVDITGYDNLDVELNNDVLSHEGYIFTPNKPGETIITLKHDNVKKEIKVEVLPSDKDLNDFSLNKSSITIDIGNTFDLKDIFINQGVSANEVTMSTLKNDDGIKFSNSKIIGTKKGIYMVVIKSKTTTQYLEIIVI